MIDVKVAALLEAVTGAKNLCEAEKGGIVDMCVAWRQQEEKGKEKGQEIALLNLITKKIVAGKSEDIIARELESTVEEIHALYEKALHMLEIS